MLELCFLLVVPIMNQNGGSNNGSKERNSTEVVDGLKYYKDTKTIKNLMISTCVIGSGLSRKSLATDGDKVFWDVMLCQLVNIYRLLRPPR
jgi:hypothetical protein